MADERRLRWAQVAALALAACSAEGSDASGTGQQPSLVPTTASVSALIVTEQIDGEEPPDGGVGLEFDPVTGRFIVSEAGLPPPRPLRPDSQLPTDAMLREEQIGVLLDAAFLPRGVEAPPTAPEVDKEGIAAAAKVTALQMKVTITAIGRMKIVSQSRALPLAFRSEVRARYDRYGHLVFWPQSSHYRVIPAGALRATIGERRVDVTPLVPGLKTGSTPGSRLDTATRNVEVESTLGRVRLELAAFPEAGLGGPLLCRALVELIGVDPAISECKPEEVPLYASINWHDGGGIDFAASAFERRTDLSPGEVLVPPPGAERSEDGLPEAPDGVYLTPAELKAMRNAPVALGPADPAAPTDGFIADNRRDQLMMLYLDGVPVVGVPPLERRFILGLLPGRYSAQWRTFLGERIDGSSVVELPGIVRSVPLPPKSDAGP